MGSLVPVTLVVIVAAAVVVVVVVVKVVVVVVVVGVKESVNPAFLVFYLKDKHNYTGSKMSKRSNVAYWQLLCLSDSNEKQSKNKNEKKQ